MSTGDGLLFLAMGIALGGYFIGLGLESFGKQIKRGMKCFLPPEPESELEDNK
jgi:hypothetical protein